jgi:hypothetical protein
MTNDSHLGSRCAEAELQHTSRFIEAVNKDNVIWKFAKKCRIVKRLESHTLCIIWNVFSRQNVFFLTFISYFPVFSLNSKCSLFCQISELTLVGHSNLPHTYKPWILTQLLVGFLFFI